ncbi:AraC family transcriptional regulator [Kineococcus rhizosphaerae]|uniref:AraC family transcriptional regulator n=1 Tax=Kineococcus rhizosphaerae TaxID=559628 RepID=A0A2T0QY58_9ACTN|nr:AraC family transcriptional regulator [Kineococcus rhizosphaerae]PRY11127.1 AraC family transcriptional regulator [Kineococcus rhizosphaerae]
MDPLSDVLAVSGVRGTLGNRVAAGGTWATAVDGGPGEAVLHAVTAGRAWLTVPARPPVELSAGDVVLVGGVPHALGDAPGTPGVGCDRAAATRRARTGEVLTLGSAPATTHVLTLAYTCDRTALTQVVQGLPDLVHVAAGAGSAGLDATVRMLDHELRDPQIASAAVLNSLVDVVLVQLLRAWLASRPATCRGTWLAMTQDPVVGRALEQLHADPARAWTTSSLAAATSVSRATLARRFPAVIGQTPAAYLTTWRMDLAAVRLRRGREPVESIAPDVGYASVPAFTRAFTRAHGRPPGRYRAEARAGEAKPVEARPA